MPEDADRIVYFDHAATTPTDPLVLDAIRQAEERAAGNAGSIHRQGTAAAVAVERSRAVIAAAIGAEPDEIVFTAGGTEAGNAAIHGVLLAAGSGHAVCSAIEHPCIAEPLRWLARFGFTHDVVPVDGTGLVDPANVERALRPDTRLVTVMHVNNEVGVVQPIAEVARLCRRRGILFHTDACQSFTKVDLDVRRDGLDLASLNAHKLHGPKGVGALFVRRGLELEPLLHGGQQESGRRAGTVNTPGVVGFARAVELSGLAAWRAVAEKRDRLQRQLAAVFPDATFNGAARERVGGILSMTLAGVGAKEVLQDLSARGICASAGSACSSGDNAPSAVLLALGLSAEAARSTLRLSLGRSTTDDEVGLVVAALAEIVARRRRGEHG